MNGRIRFRGPSFTTAIKSETIGTRVKTDSINNQLKFGIIAEENNEVRK